MTGPEGGKAKKDAAGEPPVLAAIKAEVQSFLGDGWKVVKPAFEEIVAGMPPTGNDEDDARHLVMALLKRILELVKAGKLSPGSFDLEIVKGLPAWQPLAKVILATRVDELRRCKVVRSGKKIDIANLKATSIGKALAQQLGFDRRSLLTREEYEMLEKQIARLNFTPPVIVEPTSTERFFSDQEE